MPKPENKEPATFADTPPDFRTEIPAPAKEAKEEVKAEAKPKSHHARKPPLKGRLEDVFTGISLAVASTGDLVCANVIAKQAEPMAEAWANLAKINPRVRAMIERLLTGSTWGEIIFATAPVVIAVCVHHELLPKGFPVPFSFGVPESEEVRKHEPGASEPTSGS